MFQKWPKNDDLASFAKVKFKCHILTLGLFFSDEFPFIVNLNLEYGPRPTAGGSLITISHVLTAAHCIYDKDINLMTVQILNLLAQH